MKKQTKNTVFIVSVIVILVGSLVALSFLTGKQNEPGEGFFAYNPSNYKVEGLSLDKQPMIGEKDAPVTLVIFSDFSCSHCKTFEISSLPVIEEKLIKTGKAKAYIINYAFMNDSSFKAAVAAESVYKQNPDAFLPYYKALYDIQNPNIATWANNTSLVDVAKELKLDIDYDVLEKDIKEYAYLDSVYEDRAIGEANGVTGTPGLLIHNVQVDPSDPASVTNVLFDPMDVDALEEAVDSLQPVEDEDNE